ncbi:MAG TPA: hypothetical protein VMP01_08910 [Pirellulaceae bacterium]|nr:hypothetical protein [Pirellulaceae bacterium]
MAEALTTRQVAEEITRLVDCQIQEWQVRRLFESGTLPEPLKFGGKRQIARAQVPAIIDALRERGWMPEVNTA